MRGEFILNLDKSSYRSFSTIEEAYGMKDKIMLVIYIKLKLTQCLFL